MLLDKRLDKSNATPGRKYAKSPVSLFAALLIGLSASSTPLCQTILMVQEQSSPIQDRIISGIRGELDRLIPQASVGIRNLDQIEEQIGPPSADLIITFGSQAAEKFSTSRIPVLHTLITESFYEELVKCITPDCPTRSNVYAIPLDQPVNRQLNFLSLLLPDKRSLGVLTAAFSANRTAILGEKAKEKGYEFFSQYIEDDSQLNHKLKKLLEKSDVILALPDPLIHNRRTIPHLLLTTYRFGTPLIGFSRAYVNAGAIAAVYSTPEQISRQIAELTVKILSETPPAPGLHPSQYFDISINNNVARSYGLSFPDVKTIKLKLLKLEQ
ncbi:MAG: ABC transporter substrate-binding protein [Gammaproteobacteria bacterium]